ncbi:MULTISPECIES: hypothetical protein [unclassified Streptomyces]|uniref:hypothetical protein n=1 Tax=unclassified Streptomyces TaxID=2593676 RepID=UPI001BEBDC9F|nr:MULTISPECIES: hypothetical protein [unclassified Streptomyces]MBT2408483.1 hypothetical protein [Streptomyces sp. ISL-21]MBT2457968.1 hypothetical protein [Streptomyces sp. ISL-86]MBT2611920.1 hypothetical protein [Streptomyces sp. ISL-87]
MHHRPQRIRRAAAALAVLCGSLTACGSDTFERCVPEASTTASAAQLVGTYEGSHEAEGVRLTLTATPGENRGGTLTTENWPTGSFHKSKPGKAFTGSGTWEVEDARASTHRSLLRLQFEDPAEVTSGDTLDKLSIGIDADRIFVYDDFDPDVCPAFRLELQKS